MGEFQIKTAQNVSIRQNLAGVGQRLLAVLIDMIFLGLFYYFVFYLLSLTHYKNFFSSIAFITVLMLPYFLYYPLLQYWNNGQSLGKQLMKIRIVKTDHSHPKLGDFLIRWILRLFEINIIPGLGLLFILFTDKNQRLGDLAAQTVVISEQHKTTLNHSIFEDLEQTYEPVFVEAAQLKASDVQLIKSVLIEAKKNDKAEILKRLSTKIESTLGIQKPQNMSTGNFIDTILKDYNYYAGL